MEASDTATRPAEPGDGGAPDPLAEVARHTAAFARAWSHLVASEAALAKANLALIAIGALLVPALAFALVAALDAVIAALLFDLLHGWLAAIGATVLLDAAALFVLLRMLRAWWRTLSLPHSREALTRLWRSHDDDETQRQGAAARSAV